MYISSTRLYCRECHKIFDGEIVNDAPFKVAVASMECLWCPDCGAKDLAFVLNEERLLLRLRLEEPSRAEPAPE